MTATDLTREHYARPEVKNTIINYCTSTGGLRHLNTDEKWYASGSVQEKVRLRGPADYDETIARGRTLYATLNLFQPSVFEQEEKWLEEQNAPEKPIGTNANTLAFTLSVDIDGIGDIKTPSVKEAVECAGQFFVDYLAKNGIEKSVYCLYSGGGIYVHIHHGLSTETEIVEPEVVAHEFKVLGKAFNLLISAVSRDFFRQYGEHIGKVKFDKLNNQKRTFKTIFSVHKRLPYVVIPLDPKKIKIFFSRAAIPLTQEVIDEGEKWYTTFDYNEKNALLELLKPHIEEAQENERSTSRVGGACGNDVPISRKPVPIPREDFPPCIRNIIQKATDEEGRHRALGVLATYLYQVGWEEETAFDLWAEVADRCGVEDRLFRTEWGRVCCPNCDTMKKNTGGYPNLNLHGMDMCHSDMGCLHAHWPGEYNPSAMRRRVEGIEIQANGRYLQDISADSLNSLRTHNDPPQIFVRSGHLVRLVAKDRAVIEQLNESALRGVLARVAGFVKFEGHYRDGAPKFTKTRPPIDVVRDILSLGAWPGLPTVEAIIETPVLRRDGTILIEPGYDQVTGLFYAPCTGLQDIRVPENPTAEDAKKAAAHVIREIFADFPFKDEASRANALGLLLSVVVRPIVDGNIPLALLDKPQAGTGASFLAEVVAMIATGRPANMMGAPETEDEWRKSITSALLDGSPTIVIDNVVGKLRSSSLTRALTSRIWRDRFLGKSEMIDLPQRAVWVATGNNISIGGDLARRSYWIRMDASMARPWLRTGFRHEDLLGWIRSNHARLLSDLLTMARAWIMAGRPAGLAKAIGGFKDWSESTDGILEFAGVQGFLSNASELYDSMDQDVQQWDEFLEAWATIHADHPIGAGQLRDELISNAQIYRTLQDAMPDDVAEAVRKDRRASLSLGVILGKHLDQIYPSGRRLCRERDSHSKVSLWKIAGSLEKQETVSEDHFAGSAVSNHPIKVLFEKSNKCIMVETLTALPAKPPNDGDCEKPQLPANPDERYDALKSEDPGLQKFKRDVAKRKCLLCGKTYGHDLIPYYNNGQSGYICADCSIYGPPPELVKPDHQFR